MVSYRTRWYITFANVVNITIVLEDIAENKYIERISVSDIYPTSGARSSSLRAIRPPRERRKSP